MEDRQIQIKTKMVILVVINHWKKIRRGTEDSLQADVATEIFSNSMFKIC